MAKLVADSDTQTARLMICQTCEHLQHRIVHQCAKCGCIVKLKTKWAGAECPVGKWKSSVVVK